MCMYIMNIMIKNKRKSCMAFRDFIVLYQTPILYSCYNLYYVRYLYILMHTCINFIRRNLIIYAL